MVNTNPYLAHDLPAVMPMLSKQDMSYRTYRVTS